MSPNKIGTIPEFTTDEGIEEVKKAPVGETEEEAEKPAELPAEKSEAAEEKPEETVEAPKAPSADTEVETLKEKAEREKQGLLREIEKLRKEKAEARKKDFLKADEPLIMPKEEVEDLKGINPADIDLIDKVIKSKGYVRKDEFQKISYESAKNDELAKFLEKYPEYKPENDSNDTNWNALQTEISLYKMPADPRKIGEILERAHKGIQRSFTSPLAKKRQVEIAGTGSGGAQRSASKGHLSDWQKEQYRNGGWTEAEIAELDN